MEPILIRHSKPWINEDDIKMVSRVLRSGALADGLATSRFEKKLLELTGGSEAVTAQSGSEAAALCLRSMNIGPGDEVILPTYVCHQVRDSILKVGATPVYCDCGESWNADRDAIMKVKTNRTKAVIIVNIYGILNGCTDLGIPIIEDHCQSLGISRLGSGIGFYSFNATKCITTGNGGAAVFNNHELATIARKISSPISDMAATLGLSQLERFKDFIHRRNLIAERYINELPKTLTEKLSSLTSMYFRFPLYTDLKYGYISAKMLQNRVITRRGVDSLLHREAGISDAGYPNAVAHFNQTISIPIYPAMTETDVDLVIEAVNEYF